LPVECTLCRQTASTAAPGATRVLLQAYRSFAEWLQASDALEAPDTVDNGIGDDALAVAGAAPFSVDWQAMKARALLSVLIWLARGCTKAVTC
jgi:hypothetical protein